MTVPEAELKKTDAGLIPQGEGWFVLNARDASWIRSEERGQDTDFEGGQEWAQLGFRIQFIAPGQRGIYHGERGQEDFLVVSGECVLVIEGQERRLKAWDFVHCPPWTKHAFVGAGDGPCVIVMVGSRVGGFEVVYPVNEVAAKHDASVLEETSKPDEAYARWGTEERSTYRRGVAAVMNDPGTPDGRRRRGRSPGSRLHAHVGLGRGGHVVLLQRRARRPLFLPPGRHAGLYGSGVRDSRRLG